MSKKELVGQKFGRWVVVSRAPYGESGAAWSCRCDCGNTKVVIQRTLLNGRSTSCGCYGAEQRVKANTKHGHAGHGFVNASPTYQTWHDMKRRCKDPKHSSHKRYYDKGIKVCARWEDFSNFLKDMGERPEGKTLDRLDNDGNYELSNCKWSTPKEQANNMSRNRYLEYQGERLTVSQWADKTNIPYNTLIARVRRGWTTERALSTSVNVKLLTNLNE